MNLRNVWCEDVNWIKLAQDGVHKYVFFNAAVKRQVP
jgi:hypothetical protein